MTEMLLILYWVITDLFAIKKKRARFNLRARSLLLEIFYFYNQSSSWIWRISIKLQVLLVIIISPLDLAITAIKASISPVGFPKFLNSPWILPNSIAALRSNSIIVGIKPINWSIRLRLETIFREQYTPLYNSAIIRVGT